MFYNDEEGLDGLQGRNRAQTTTDASFGPIGTCFFNINIFFLFLFIFYYDTQQPWTGQRPPHLPHLQTWAGGGGFHSSHPTPPSSLANMSRGWVFHHPPSTPKANAGPQRPTQAKRRPTAANEGQCRPTKAHSSPRKPTKAPSRRLPSTTELNWRATDSLFSLLN